MLSLYISNNIERKVLKKMKTKKILAVFLSIALLFSLLAQSAWADAWQSGPLEAQDNSESLQEGLQEDPIDGASPLSLLPLEYYYENVTIDRTEKLPYELATQPADTVYVYEVLKDALIKHGLMTEEEEKYSGTIVYTMDYNESNYTPIGWDDTFSLGSDYGRTVHFIVGDGDQFNPDNIKFNIYVTLNLYIEKEVIIDRTESFPAELIDQPEGTVYIGELLNDVLLELGYITEENQKFNGTIKTEVTEFDLNTGVGTEVLKEVTQEDTFLAHVYDDFSPDSVNFSRKEFTIDDGKSTETSFKRVVIRYKYTDTGKDLLLNSTVKVYNKSNKEIIPQNKSLNSATYLNMEGKEDKILYQLANIVSAADFENEEAPKISMALPEKYALGTKIYLGWFWDESGIDESKNITAQITGEEAYQLTQYNMPIGGQNSATRWNVYVTFAVNIDGRTVFVPTNLYVDVTSNYVNLQGYFGNSYVSSYSVFSDPAASWDEQIGLCGVVSASDFDNLKIKLRGTYYNYIDSYESDSDGKYVKSAYLGSFETEDEAIAAGAENIKNSLFASFTSDLYTADFTTGDAQTAYVRYYNGTQYDTIKVQLKSLEFTVFDTFGLVHHPVYNLAIDKTLSDDTYFRISGADKRTDPDDEGSASSLSSHVMARADDSYSINGYQTVFIMDYEEAVADGTTIYPTFETDPSVKVFNGLDATEETSTNHQQISGKSPVLFKNGEAIQYSAASESGTHLKNYWVTYVTPVLGGAKLFVNATNNPDHYDGEQNIPVREIFFNSTYGYSHDIMIANIGDQELTGIKVSLEDAKGVELDPYWTVLDTGLRKLAPFTSVWKDYGYSGELTNIAKIRLNAVDDYFGAISGTLTISADGQEPVVIKLTGIAGTPKIVTDKIYDGVKYVPYSSVIMTNSMYEDDSMEFSIINGTLPEGIDLLPNGELYGLPKETGDFTFTVQAKYTGTIASNIGGNYTDARTYTLTVKDNTDENVDAVNTDMQGYKLTDRVSRLVTVYYNGVDDSNLPIIDRVVVDSNLFRSEGSYTDEFKAFYIDSYKLTEGTDYTAEEGSTKITVLAETFEHIGLSDSSTPHTLAAEFRNEAVELRHSAQNVYIEYINQKKPGGNNTPTYPLPFWPSYPQNSTIQPSVNSVYAVFSIEGADGKPAANLSLELHSSVKYAATDSNGIASFSGVEFGRHTLYVTNPATGKKVSKTFTIVSGFNSSLTDDIIFAEVGRPVHISMVYDGNSLGILSAESDIENPTEGTINNEEAENNIDREDTAAVKQKGESDSDVTDDMAEAEDKNPSTGILPKFIFAALASISCAVSIKRKSSC